MEALGLDEVWWLVSPGNPLKPAAGHGALCRAPRLGPADRRGAAAIRVSDFEAQAGTRYTVDTLSLLVRALARRPLHLADGRGHCGPISTSWKAWRELAATRADCGVVPPGL